MNVGAAAGSIAKTMSACNMAVIDAIYYNVDRYLSRARMLHSVHRSPEGQV